MSVTAVVGLQEATKRLRYLDIAARYARSVGAIKERHKHDPEFFGLQVAVPKEISAETKAFFKKKQDEKRAEKGLPPKKDNVPSAASMFRTMIMEGKLTDDQIFKAVQDAHGLPQNRRTYVDWYRKQLLKDGKNPPKGR